MKKTISATLILCVLLSAKAVFAADVYRSFFANRIDLYLDTSYFSSTANYDSTGTKKNLPLNSKFQNISMETSARFLFFNNFGFYSGLIFNNVDSNNGAVARNTSSLANYFVGADYQLFQGERWNSYADFSFSLASTMVEAKTDSALASNGANDAKVIMVAAYSAEALRFFGKLGADYRTEGLSALLVYGLGGDYGFGSSRLGLGLEGSSSVKDDELTNQALLRDAITNRVDAGSRRYYSINPNLLTAEIYFQHYFGQSLNMKVLAGSTVTGSNSAEGIMAGISLNWGFGVAPTATPPRTDKPQPAAAQDPGFKVDTNDGVNQEIFQPVSKPKPKK